MPDFGLYAKRDPLRAARILDRIKRYAERRSRFLDALDMQQLSPAELRRIYAVDDDLNDVVAFGTLYVEHLHGLDLERQLLR
ncbi:hypothetical protein PK98_15210 [Croceibacterium mercuriale]|uniref:Uncharacterized protein n=1 Tax=Croceibacterium mercuriale TaxID=1572751 RepID=A0A0B2BXC4_9SPHN|nr:hypothetical protein [Croceibacterium mercuriale]KHL24306.1 hypothetical protein PK98_15210 [Croceibacterium mercuriale]